MVRKTLSVVMAAAAAAAPLAAQSRPAVEVTPQIGAIVFGDMWKGPVGTSLSSANGTFYAAQLAFNVTDALALVGSVGGAQTDLRAGLPILGGVRVGESETLLYDAGLQLRLRGAGAGTIPFIEGGIGGSRTRIRVGPVDVRASNPAYHVGAGVDLDLSPSFGLRLMARDYIGRFDFEDAILLDVESRTAHNLALTAGIRVGF